MDKNQDDNYEYTFTVSGITLKSGDLFKMQYFQGASPFLRGYIIGIFDWKKGKSMYSPVCILLDKAERVMSESTIGGGGTLLPLSINDINEIGSVLAKHGLTYNIKTRAILDKNKEVVWEGHH